jgi:hypothetical protein
MYTTRLASKEIFSPSNKIYREVGRTKDLSAPLYIYIYVYIYIYIYTHIYTGVMWKFQ